MRRDPNGSRSKQNRFDGSSHRHSVSRICDFFSNFTHFFKNENTKNREEVDALTRTLGCRFIRTSVKEDVNVSSVFRYLATKCHQIMMQHYNIVPVGQPTISKKISFL